MSESYCNEKELALLPLFSEIACIGNPNVCVPEEFRVSSFPMFKELISLYNHEKILKLLSKLEVTEFGSNKYILISHRLFNKLCDLKYEPLWRHIFNKLEDSQAKYSPKLDGCDTSDAVMNVRTTIQKLMEESEYSGTYPDFYKHGEIRGVRIAESSGRLYFVANEKRAVHRIHCNELRVDEYCTVRFFSGTALLRENETADDIFACMFNAKGRRISNRYEYCELLFDDIEDKIKADELAMSISIAQKRAELRKLSKEERKKDPSLISVYVCFFLLVGVVGTVAAFGMMLIAFIVSLIAGRGELFPDLIMGFPWWKILLFTWAGSAVAFGIYSVFFSKNK